ncbi:MAG TPA: response regulator [Rubrivivax sp.]|jgi:two-component system KDP operon response regulator KdpE|nr:response regulator [Rubrivivax sp.]
MELRARILVVEDEPDIRRFVRMTLESEGHEVFEAATLERGLIEAGSRRPELAIVDLGLPDGDGVDLIRDLRTWSTAPIIVLSARSGETDKVGALDAGADDYLVKPFGAAELLARVRAQLRRLTLTSPSADPVLRFGSVTVDLTRRVVERQGAPVHLTPIEYRLLTHLASQPDRVVTHQQLLKAVWGPGHAQDTHYVRVHMANLRKKIEDEPSMPKHLLTEAGVGYRFRP